MTTAIPLRSKEWLLHLLAEAAELEHNLLCSYLFALFSLKESTDEGISSEELQAVDRWRGSLLGVCIEEMTHLAQICNLTLAIGGRPHLDRPNIPVAAGYHPASVVVEFSRLDLDTLQHFVFLERPDGSDTPDGPSFQAAAPLRRLQHHGALMPSSPEYETIGAFYASLAQSLTDHAREVGEPALFSGPIERQLRPEDLNTASLLVIRTLEDALAAIQAIVEEGEGAASHSETSHHALFVNMRDEMTRLMSARPGFDPSRPVGRNPVMHAPVADGRTHVTHPQASAVLDAANATYGLMLRCLALCYDTPADDDGVRRPLVNGCVGAMHALSLLGRELTRMPAADGQAPMAGVSFAMLRSMQGHARPEDAHAAIASRAAEITNALDGLAIGASAKSRVADALACFKPRPRPPVA